MSRIVVDANNVSAYFSNLEKLRGLNIQTDNGAASYSLGNISPFVALYFKSVRGIETDYLTFLIDSCWEKDRLDTLRLLFHIRDCREGKGEKDIFYRGMKHLLNKNSEAVLQNMKHFPEYGYWKDFLNVFCGTQYQQKMIEYWSDVLVRNLENLSNNSNLEDFGAVKFAPNEKSYYDKTYSIVFDFCKCLGITRKQYRKNILRPLRDACPQITETLMCSQNWDQIVYSSVPSIAFSKYRNAFKRHDDNRFERFLYSVQKGETHLNTSVLHPHTIIEKYFSTISNVDASLEAMWTSYIRGCQQTRNSNISIFPIVDCSGSMMTGGRGFVPLYVAIAIGMCVSMCNTKRRNEWCTFSSQPSFETFSGETLLEKIRGMNRRNWGMNTDLVAVFDKLLQIPSEMPEVLLILSDMQFDSGVDCRTNWERIEAKFKNSGIPRPTIVWWNLNGNTLDIPQPHDKISNTVMLSGFNPKLVDTFVHTGQIPTPEKTIANILNSERYARITI